MPRARRSVRRRSCARFSGSVIIRAVVRILVALAVLLSFACASAPPAPEPAPQTGPPAVEKPLGTVRVTASGLNVRRDPLTSSDILATAGKGEQLEVLANGEGWMKVRTAKGDTGWVSSRYVARDDGRATAGSKPRRKGCAPDADFAFAKTPMPAFSDSSAHGLVVVEANVDARGDVKSTKVISNSTGDEALAFLAEKEIRGAKFEPLVRNCAAVPFIFTYKRAF